MILSFMTHFENGKPTYFAHKILDCEAIYRECQFGDESQMLLMLEKHEANKLFDQSRMNLYKPKIHTLRKDKGNRWKKGTKIHFSLWNRTPRQTCFGVLPCTGTQRVVLVPEAKEITLIDPSEKFGMRQIEDIEQFAKNDGFDSVEEFWQYFNKPEAYTIIHWTDFKY